METPPRPKIPKIIILGGISVALIVTALWAAYEFWSPEKAGKLSTLFAVLMGVLIVVLLVIWLVWKLVIWMRESRARRQDEASARPKPGASPEEQAALETMQERLNTAVKVIRESKLARGRSAEEALYALPWVVLLGPPDSGKTTLLRDCGVDFPYTTLESHRKHRGEVPSCEYWFSRGGIALDLAGVYAVGNESIDAFSGFVDQLKRARKTRPVDGVVVAVSIRDLLDQSEQDVEKLANQLRQRFDLMIRRLGIRFPIYIVFTKCDQVEGFGEFFGNLRSRDRGQIWGATISRGQRKRFPAAQLFQQEFDRLVETLNSFRLQLLSSETESYRQAQIFTFPARFTAVREKLANFIGTLLEPTPYSERPMFRGFYLTSALGTPERAAVSETAQKWEPGIRPAAPAEQPGPTAKTFFMQELLPKVIFADRPLATASVDTRLRRRLRHDVALIATVAVSLLLVILFCVSFVKNSGMLASVAESMSSLTTSGGDARTTQGLRSLEDLRQQLLKLESHAADGTPLSLRWGLYSGSTVREPVRRQYYRQLRNSYVNPSAERVRQQLYSMSAQNQGVSFYDFYNQLKTYLWMTPQGGEPAPEESFMNNSLEAGWKRLAPQDAEGSVLALTQLRYYAQKISQKEPDLVVQRDPAAVERACKALLRYSLLERVYASLKNDGNQKLKPLTLDLMTGGKSDYVAATRDVPGIFTESGWNTYFRDAIGQASRTVTQNDWVLGCAGGPASSGMSLPQAGDAGYESKMREWYFSEYADEWLKFLDGVSVRPFGDLNEARTALESLSLPDYSLSRLLLAAAQNTMLRREPGAKAVPATGQRVPRDELVPLLAERFAPLHEAVSSPDGKLPSASAQYFEVLGRLRSQIEMLVDAGGQWDQVKGYVGRVSGGVSGDEFHDAYRSVQRIRQACSASRYTSAVPNLLEQPLRFAWNSLLRDMLAQVDTRWKTQVADQYRREVANMFPFNPEGQDLPLPTFTKYFKPNDGLLWTFYEREIRPLAGTEEPAAAPVLLFTTRLIPSRAFLVFMEKSKAVRDGFYATGGAEPALAFELIPEGTEDVIESILEIDGQPPLRYRNEVALPHSFTWPGRPGPPQARLSVAVTRSAERPNIPLITGDWAFFRLLSMARVDTQSASNYLVVWSPPSGDSRKFSVKYRLNARSAANPFAPGFFKGMNCPERVTAP